MSTEPITTEEFDAALDIALDGVSQAELLAIPGVYECVSEYFNNLAISIAVEQRRIAAEDE
jgi:hypothetical protein